MSHKYYIDVILNEYGGWAIARPPNAPQFNSGQFWFHDTVHYPSGVTHHCWDKCCPQKINK